MNVSSIQDSRNLSPKTKNSSLLRPISFYELHRSNQNLQQSGLLVSLQRLRRGIVSQYTDKSAHSFVVVVVITAVVVVVTIVGTMSRV